MTNVITAPENLSRELERDINRWFDSIHEDLPDAIEDRILVRVQEVSPKPGREPYATGALGESFEELREPADGVGTREPHAATPREKYANIVNAGRKPDKRGRMNGSEALPTGFADAFAELAAEALGIVAQTVTRRFKR